MLTKKQVAEICQAARELRAAGVRYLKTPELELDIAALAPPAQASATVSASIVVDETKESVSEASRRARAENESLLYGVEF